MEISHAKEVQHIPRHLLRGYGFHRTCTALFLDRARWSRCLVPTQMSANSEIPSHTSISLRRLAGVFVYMISKSKTLPRKYGGFVFYGVHQLNLAFAIQISNITNQKKQHHYQKGVLCLKGFQDLRSIITDRRMGLMDMSANLAAA